MSFLGRFEILGSLRVRMDAKDVDLGGPKQRAVLAVLLINANRPLTGDQLIEALWGDQAPPSARSTLQAYISNLRKVLEPERPARTPARLLQKNGAGYQLTIAPEQLDSLRFEQLVSEASDLAEIDPERCCALLDDGLRLWRGPALADFRYDGFAQGAIARLEELHISARELRFDALLAVSDDARLVPELETLVEGHPYRERLWGQLMLALYRAGRQAEALRAYRRCEKTLAELGIAPGQALRSLEKAILDQDAALARPGSCPTPVDAARVVGRQGERERIRSILTETDAGRGSIVLVDGEAGIGKTRFLEMVQAEAKALGFSTALARCVEIGGSPPFWPWIQLTRRLGSADLVEAARAYHSYLAPLLPDRDEPVAGPLFRVAEGLAVAISALAEQRPLVLLIDDILSADPDSLSVLNLLAPEIREARVSIVCSHRSHELSAGHPPAVALAELSRLDHVHRISLLRLGLAEISEMVESLVGASVDDATIDAIHRRSEGNPFFAVELTKLLVAEDSLSPERMAAIVPTTVMGVIGRVLARLSPTALRLIRGGAVAGREFELLVVAESLGIDPDTAVSAADEVIGVGLLMETGRPGVLRFSHLIVVNSVVHGLGGLRKAQLHHEIARSMEEHYGEDAGRWVEIAHHRVGAIAIAGVKPAIAAVSRAGAHAFTVNALELAQQLFEQRLALVATVQPSPGRDELEIEALFDLGRVWTWLEGYHSPRLRQAAGRLWELTGITRGDVVIALDQPVDHSHPVLAAYQAQFSVDIVSGDINAAVTVTERLLDLALRHDDAMVTYAANQTALTSFVHAGRLGDALRAAETAREALEELDPERRNHVMLPLLQQPAWLSYHAFAAWLHWLRGDASRCRAELQDARRMCERTPNPCLTGFVATIEGIVGAMEGAPARVFDSQRWASSVADGQTFGPVPKWLAIQAAWASGMTDGNPMAAHSRIIDTLAELTESGAEVAQTLYWGLAAELSLAAREYEVALDMTNRGIARAITWGERFWYPELERLRAEALRHLGRYEEATDAVQRARRAATETGASALAERLAAAPAR